MPALEPDLTWIKMTHLSVRAFLSENKKETQGIIPAINKSNANKHTSYEHYFCIGKSGRFR